jgi:hypothetical protein
MTQATTVYSSKTDCPPASQADAPSPQTATYLRNLSAEELINLAQYRTCSGDVDPNLAGLVAELCARFDTAISKIRDVESTIDSMADLIDMHDKIIPKIKDIKQYLLKADSFLTPLQETMEHKPESETSFSKRPLLRDFE